MPGFDSNEDLTPFSDPRGSGEYGAIVSDRRSCAQVDARWFVPDELDAQARRVTGSGRGGAWRIESNTRGALFVRQYLRGGWVARLTRERHLWRGAARVRSFAEFRLLRQLKRHGLPVPAPVAACYLRRRFDYRAWIVLDWLPGTQSFAARVGKAAAAGDAARSVWNDAGVLIARFHRAGLDHADLNAHNLLIDVGGKLWLIDFDRSRLRIPETNWRQRNLARLKRSLLKLHGSAHAAAMETGFGHLCNAYQAHWARGL